MENKLIKLGITGTRAGFSTRQITEFTDIIQNSLVSISEFHHGNCIGVDFEACCIIRRLSPKTLIIAHPPIQSALRANFKSDIVRVEKDYLDRNKDIVNECELLYVIPRTNHEQLRSGTWSTFRYAKKIEREFIILER